MDFDSNTLLFCEGASLAGDTTVWAAGTSGVFLGGKSPKSPGGPES